VKVIRLESYEDALNNIEVNGQAGQVPLKFDDYMLSYMLDWETRESPTRLNLRQLEAPFAYKLRITHNQQTREQVVDVPETFAYLLGLHVRTRRVYDDGRRYLVYHGALNHRDVVVIWRDTHEWDQEDYERDKTFVVEQKLAESADEVFVNGDSLIPGARSLDGLFKGRMFAPVGA
jgi:adenine-specific DNA-methyltransferase